MGERTRKEQGRSSGCIRVGGREGGKGKEGKGERSQRREGEERKRWRSLTCENG